MTDATTDDCKAFIATHAADLGLPTQGAWKRKSKTKGPDGWVRLFEHAGGTTLRLIEPFGAGAAGLRVDDAPSTQASTSTAKPAAPFESANPAMQAAMLWRDAMRAIGGVKPLHTDGPNNFGWNWKQFAKEHHDYAGDHRDDVQELTQKWVDLGMAEPASRALMLDGISWCFDSDAEFCDQEGWWSSSEGALVAVWPTDAPDEFGTELGNPIYSTDLDNSMECIFHAGAGAASGREAFIRAWDEMKSMGCHFDMARQKDFNENSDYDEDHPIDKKIKKIIPELIAATEARKIAKAAASADTPTPRSRPGL